MRHGRRTLSLTKGKTPIKKSDTNISSVGPASAPGSFNVLETQGGARSTTGAEVTIKSSATTGEICNVGDVVKYVTLFLQSAGRLEIGSNTRIPGWIEWAFICVKESETTLPITQLGVLTLPNVAMNMYRNECIYTGIMPVGFDIPNFQEIKIKIPKEKCKIRLGDEWRFITSYRSSSTVDVSTDRMRLIKSFSYKCYS